MKILNSSVCGGGPLVSLTRANDDALRSTRAFVACLLKAAGWLLSRTTCPAKLLMLLMVLLTPPASVRAQDFIYTTNNGTITITKYNGPGGAVSIPEAIEGLPVTSIASGAFYARTSLTSVTIPKSVTRVSNPVFVVCNSLTSVYFMGNAPASDNNFFAGYPTSTRVYYMSGTTGWGVTFGGCPTAVFFVQSPFTYVVSGSTIGIIEYIGPGGVVSIPAMIDGLQVTSIEKSAFCRYTNLISIAIPDSVINIGDRAFSYCDHLTSISIPDSVISIGPWAFNGCTSLGAATIGNGVASIPEAAFYHCSNLSSLAIGNRITTIEERAFAFCSSLTSVTIPDSVTNIGDRAFYCCSTLTSAIIPDSVANIGAWTFFECSSLTNVTIPTNATVIGVGTFSSCISLGAVHIPDNITWIGGGAFSSCSSLTNIMIPDSVAMIQDGAFEYCTNLTGVTIPNSVTNIGSCAFSDCYSITNVTIPESVTRIGDAAFCYCTSLRSIKVDERNSFYGSLDGVLFNRSQNVLMQYPGGKGGAYAIPAGFISIGDSAFSDCYSLTGVTIPDSVTSVGNNAFSDCYSLSNVVIGNSVAAIGAGAFNGCSNLPSISIPDTGRIIGSWAFADCCSLAAVYFHGDAPSLGDYVFDGDNNATVYYLWGSTGWGATFGDRPTALWNLPPRVAAANAIVMNGFVIDAAIADGGLGYTNIPAVRILEGGGSGAQAVAVVSNGVVTAIRILDAGYGYTNQPVIVIAPPFIEQPLMSVKAMSLLNFANLVAGTSYEFQAFSMGAWSNLGSPFTASNATFAHYVFGTAGAGQYRLVVSPVPNQAYATAQVVNGFVVGAIVTSGGSGYSTTPAVTISGGGGVNATAAAHVSGGVVTYIGITSAGIGYSNTPTIAIAPPLVNALSPIVSQAMKLGLSRLAPYERYQLELCPELGGVRSDLGEPFMPTSSTNTSYINVSGNAGFFRARHLP